MNIFGNSNFDIIGKRKIALAISLLLMIISIAAVSIRGFNLGLDFTGGTVIVVHFDEPVELDIIRTQLGNSDLRDAVVKNFGSSKDIEITLPPIEVVRAGNKAESGAEVEESKEALLSNRVLDILQEYDSSARISKADFVGSQVGDELMEKGSLALLYAVFGILVYVTIRFEWRFSLGAIAALVHDVIIVSGVFAIWQVEFDLTVLAALLAVIGYSLNDTIVVFDRIRENFLSGRKGEADVATIINTSINQTLSRTIVTSFTTLIVLIALYIFGGDLINSFAFALIIGIVVGTYSSIFIASSATLALGVSREDLIPAIKEGGNFDHIP